MTNCEFCVELGNVPGSRFGQIYSGRCDSRIVARSGSLVAMPTLGQLFAGSLLVLPVEHIETAAAFPREQLEDLESFILQLGRTITGIQHFIAFEHGARCFSHGGCGIYHAHVHIVPVPTPMNVKQLFTSHDGESPESLSVAPTLRAAWSSLTDSSEYLLVRDTFGNIAYAALSPQESAMFGSQYFRKRLVQLCRLDRSWDWRTYTNPEPDVLKTLSLFPGAAHALV